MFLIAEGAIIAGKYRLERALARGGMGSVWIARHLQLDAEVAIKLIAPEHASSAEARARFEREAKASAQLRTPNVVQVYDYGVEDGTPYIAMELLDGEDLGARLEREGRLSPAAMLIIVNQVCRALRRAHEVGLVHRDLKPANIFLARQDGEEVVKILDFGIAKDTGLKLSGSATKTGTLLGSPYYMSPEQVRRSREADPRSDLWSLGVIMFQCLTGQLPFRAEELGELFLEICSEDLPRASQVAPDLGPAMDGLLARALARNPAERFQSAQELAAAFAAVVSPRDASSSADLSLSGAQASAAVPARIAEGAPSNLTNLHGPQGGMSTLSPMGNSLVVQAGRGPRREILLALLVGALALGLIGWSVIRARAPSAALTPPLDAVAPQTSPTSAAAAPSATASAATTASASAVAPPRRLPPPTPRGTQPPPKQPRTRDDPTSHM